MRYPQNEILVIGGEAEGMVVANPRGTPDRYVRIYSRPKFNPQGNMLSERTPMPVQEYVLEELSFNGVHYLPMYVPYNWLRNATHTDMRKAYARLVLFYYAGENTLEGKYNEFN